MDHKYIFTIFLLKNILIKFFANNYPTDIIMIIIYFMTKLKNIKISAGYHHAIIQDDNKIHTLGSYSNGQLGHSIINCLGKVVNKIEFYYIESFICGGHHTIGITSYGYLYGWGLGRSGQLGLGIRKSYDTPQLIRLYGALKICCGEFHTVAITTRNDVLVWGNNSEGPPSKRGSETFP